MRVLRMVMDEMVNAGQLSPEFVDEVNTRMAFDLTMVSEVMLKSSQLAGAANQLKDWGDLKVQIKILQKFLVETLRGCTDRHIKERAVHTVELLRLEAGVPVEQIEAFLQEPAEDTTTTVEVPAIEGAEDS